MTLTSLLILGLFSLFFVFFLFWLLGHMAGKSKRKIENMLEKLSFTVKLKPEQKTGDFAVDKGIKRGIIGEKILTYALKLTPGHKKILSSLYIPVGDDNFTEIDSVLINEHGIFVWEAKNYVAMYYYGKPDADFWYKYHEEHIISQVEKEIETGEPSRRAKKFTNPLKQNRSHMNAIQKQLRINGFDTQKIHMFSGVAFANMYEERCNVVCHPDEAACYTPSIPEVMKKWEKMSKSELSRDEIDKIAAFLGQFVDASEERKAAHIKKLKEIYGENEANAAKPKVIFDGDFYNEDCYYCEEPEEVMNNNILDYSYEEEEDTKSAFDEFYNDLEMN